MNRSGSSEPAGRLRLFALGISLAVLLAALVAPAALAGKKKKKHRGAKVSAALPLEHDGITLTPLQADLSVGVANTVTATVRESGIKSVGRMVEFEAIDGPHKGLLGVGITGLDGVASLTYSGEKVGIDHVVASYTTAADVCVNAQVASSPASAGQADGQCAEITAKTSLVANVNWSARIAADDPIVTADRIRPTVKIAGRYKNCQTHSPLVQATANDDRRVAAVRFYVDGDLIKNDTVAPYGFHAMLPSWCRVNHRVTSVAVDSSGNENLDTRTVKRCRKVTKFIPAPIVH